MSAVSKPADAGRKPMWDEKWMWQRTRASVIILASIVGVLSMALIVWVLFFAPIIDAPPNVLPAGADLALVLAPVLAAAAGVERMLETIFNTLEGLWHSAVAYLGYGMRWLKSAETELDEARQWLQNASTIYNGTMATYNQKIKDVLKELNVSTAVTQLPDQVATTIEQLKKEADEKTTTARALLEDAQHRLDAAERKLSSLTDSAEYKAAKSAASIMLGLMLGVIVAALGQIQMFAMLGIGAVPASADVLITGLVIGTGTYPVHSLVGILQQGKNALDSLQGYLQQAGKAKDALTNQLMSNPDQK
jgi:HPt (histidine-containing phosphotransfer) domain-containing protein